MDTLLDLLRNAALVLWFFTILGIGALLLFVPLAILVYTIADVLNRGDISGGKFLWILVVLFVPLLGVAMYWITRPAEQTVTRPIALRRSTAGTDTGYEANTSRAA